MNWIMRTLSSSIGMKLIMALSGLGMVGFLLAHMGGNLLVFWGPDAINDYAAGLRKFPALLFVARVGLVTMLVAHVFTAVRLTRQNRKATPQKYAYSHPNTASSASRSMAITGALVLFYILYHLAHFTWRWTHPEFATLGPFDAYTMLVESFKSVPLSILYIVSVILVGKHLSHGISSACHTLAINHLKYTPFIKLAGTVVSVVIALGFIAIPVSVLLGIVS